ncbi:MAG TPA: nicotinate-nucleotide--dimethylbenzimidazole phosphoribosyltransferase, partial [Actinophytocola sp.]|nr:nicotinate-nucleotide--dimethylbenzimidazole phosphoribosyltransferase [Actinophytocola sp.]
MTDPVEFDTVSPPDEPSRQAALTRHEQLTKPRGSLGRLEQLGAWLAACQGQCPPKPLERAKIVVFAGDHGVTARGVSAYPSEVTAQMVANFRAGGAAINVLAASVGAQVRVVDLAVDAEPDTEPKPDATTATGNEPEATTAAGSQVSADATSGTTTPTDTATDTATGPGTGTTDPIDTADAPYKVRRSSGSIDIEDALTDDEVYAAIAAGKAIA